MLSTGDFLNGKILIVDDLEANVRLLERMLSGAGYTSVTSTRSPREVCDLHRTNRYDLILLDLQMPGMDGFEVMEGLKEIETEGYLPVLVITAQPEHKLRALQAGARDFIGKPFDLAEVLMRVRNMLEVRLLHREAKNYGQALERTLRDVEAEQKVSERLLLNVLPRAIADRLKGRRDTVVDGFPELIADSFSDVTVLFADIVGFTRFSAGMSPEHLVVLLNEIFSEFDGIAAQRGLEKIKSIGDAYMAAAGVPVPAADHATRAAHMALDLIEALDRFNRRRGYELQLRIGMHSGAVVAGVIGTHKFIYDLWGDTVNTASRMESHGVAARVQLTEATRRHLDEPFHFEARGTVSVKGMGDVPTWFLTGRNDAPPNSVP
ncbi:MAG: adenylate/guanylate cyclase domain-containing protein [FCB group bacterium]|jgi:adenylate cyclase|nr:adenylate/guanylate cyclase domain-containing protein [FCB group bacterium]